MNQTDSFVIVNGKKININRADNSLSFRSLNVEDLSRVQGLDSLRSLRSLDIGGIGISEIKCINTLINLRWLKISGNRLTEIKGLEDLEYLEKLPCFF